ncbi:hypothetical protein KEM54_003588 [Ascosphaera aggregata]|nr:hypothetical protein KEM54_003588 [Ascosphaera aggregata]
MQDWSGYCQTLPWDETYFHPKAMYNKYRGSMGHFQLRNLMSVTASNTVQYVSKDKVYSTIPFYDEHDCILDLEEQEPEASSHRPLLISTMKAKHGITAVGDVGGEFAMKSDDASISARRQLGENQEMITHVDVVESRASHSPQVVVCSNDKYVRTIDCATDEIIQTFDFARAVNCSESSADGRMRVMIGDAPEAWVIDSDTGKAIKNLNHHNDFGFACVWSPDMLHIATSNQDKTVNIWDTRMWRLLTSINADVACYRSLRYSPVGGGPRTLLMCEPADHVSLVNAQTYQTRQAIDFFGEIGGADFSPDGGRLWISNLDPTFGGLMEYERCQWGQESGLGHLRKVGLEEADDAYLPDQPNEWIDEAYLSEDWRCVLNTGERRLRYRRLLPEKGFSPAWRVLTAGKRR